MCLDIARLPASISTVPYGGDSLQQFHPKIDLGSKTGLSVRNRLGDVRQKCVG